MSKSVKIKRGVDIKLVGEAEKILVDAPWAKTVAIKPPDFEGIKPKVVVKAGQEVKAGTPLMYDKNHEKVKFTSPVSGEVVEVKRGDKRKLLEIIILADKEIRYEDFKAANPKDLKAEEIVDKICAAGLWPMFKQRPYDIIANPDQRPRDIFISTFDSSPMAPDNDFILHGQLEIFQKGVDALVKLTDGKVHFSINGATKADEVFTDVKNVVCHQISGPHPAGNVGVQIHHFSPIGDKDDIIWTITPQDILTIGRLFDSGKFDARRVISLSGSQVKEIGRAHV